jgi:hypothetical protein
MGTISSPQAVYGLKAIGTPTKTQVANDAAIGVSNQTVNLTGATKAYCVSATLATAADTLTIDTSTGIATIGTTPVSQVETATVVAASGATSSGNLAVTVTGARIAGSPLAFSVALVTGVDATATLIAAKIRTAFNANTALTSVYTVGGSGANVTLTEKIANNNDATLNIAIAAGLGVSAIVSSTNTTTGIGGVKLTNNTGDGKDFEGVSLGSMVGPIAILVRSISGSFDFEWAGDSYAGNLPIATAFSMYVGGGSGTSFLITATTVCEVEVTFAAT